jgi:hypothetical protein
MNHAKQPTTLQIKSAQTIATPGDQRPWGVDVFGVHDDYAAPITNSASGPLGPPTIDTEEGASTNFAACLVPVLARLQGYDPDGSVWHRVAVDASGRLVVAGTVSITGAVTTRADTPLVFDYAQVAIGTSETILIGDDTTRSYIRFDVPPGSPDVYISPAGSGSVDAPTFLGIRVTPDQPFTMQGITSAQQWVAMAASGSVDVSIVFGTQAP